MPPPPLRFLLPSALLLLAASSLHAQGYRPDEAAGKMRTADGLAVQLFACEPEVRQPILVKCDERGRLWTIQYLQYPNPAGLKRVKVDRFSRTAYDRIPEPTPQGPKGADRITICEDTDGDGKADRFKDFVDGLNLCTGLAFGHGGVWVLQVPYLLFYSDRNRDDVPDGDPEVVLEGFGMEDAQSLVNHLTWGPDGWLYGVTGSTVTNKVRGLEFQQAVWRYHPRSRRFELFCEGGGNLFGLTFDADGNLFASSNGSMLALHAVQGAYYAKAFDKHGPLHNPHAYGHFEHLRFTGPARGPTPGGTVYLGDSLPASFHGTLLCCDFLDHSASSYRLSRRGSTFQAAFAGRLLDSRDTWFCAPDLCYGPDGSVYICDFHDRRTAHPDPDADWDRSNGRIYRIAAQGTRPVKGLDLARKSSRELVELLRHPNGWFAAQSRVLLAARRDRSVWPALRAFATQTKDPRLALQGLWGLYVSGGWDDDLGRELLDHPGEHVRSWTVRLLGDEGRVGPATARRLAELASTEPSVLVRAQLAATARRLPGKDGLPLVERLLKRDLDRDDPHVPLLLWWALADRALTDQLQVLDFFTQAENLTSNLVRFTLPRLIRRYAAEGSRPGYEASVRLLRAGSISNGSARPAADASSLLAALDQGLSERGAVLGGMGVGRLFTGSAGAQSSPDQPRRRTFEPLDAGLQSLVRDRWQEDRDQPLRLRLAIRAGVEEAEAHLLKRLSAGKDVTALLAILEELGHPSCVPFVLPLIDPLQPVPVQQAALAVLARFAAPETTETLLRQYDRLTPAVRSRVRDVLFSRRESARVFLARVDEKKIAAGDVPLEQLRRLALFQDSQVEALVRKHWGNIKPGTPEEKLADMRRFANDLRAGTGDRTRGKELFKQHCATCHRLFGEGGQLGPDLTGFARGDTEALLASLVDPSAVIRKEFLSQVITTRQGVTHTGLIVEQDGGSLTLANAQNNRTRIRRDDVEEMYVSPTSLMPERLLDALTPLQRRDLFRYLQGNEP